MPKSGGKWFGKGAKAQRALKKKEPQLVEPDRKVLALRGTSTSQVGFNAIKDLATLKKPDSKLLTRNNEILAFEDASSLEFLVEKNDCSAFLLTTHNKKRPHNLVLGRTFDGHVLDMIEMGIAESQSLEHVEGPKKLLGAKPLFVFQGDEWDRHLPLEKLRSLLLDCFAMKSSNLPKVALPAIDHVVAVTAVPAEGAGAGAPAATGAWNGRIVWRVYTVLLKRSGGVVPRVELLPHGPSYDWTIRRTQFAASDLEKEAMRVPAQLKPKKVKNISHDEFGETLGRIHLGKQDFSGLHLRKTKALKAERKAAKRKEGESAGEEERNNNKGEDEGEGEDEQMGGQQEQAPAAKIGQKRRR